MDLIYDTNSEKFLMFELKKWLKPISFLGLGVIQFFLLIITLIIFLNLSSNLEKKWRFKKYTLIAIISIICSSMSAEVLTYIIGRARPGLGELFTFEGPNFMSGFDSFPSGHTTTSFALTVVTIHYFPKIKWFIISAASMVALSRIFLGLHYPSDVVAGIILGIINGRFILNYLENHLKNNFYRLEKLDVKNNTKLNYYIFCNSEKLKNIIKDLIEIYNQIPANWCSKNQPQSSLTVKHLYPYYDFSQNKWSTLIKIPYRETLLYLKVFRYYGIEQLKSVIMYPPKSYKFFNATKHLSKLGINVPHILAFGEIKKGILLKRCFLLYEELQGTSLNKISNLSYNALKDIAKLIHKFHSLGIYHGDLRPQNIIYNYNTNSIGFIDLDKIKIRGKNNLSLIIQDLGKLNDPKLNLKWFSRIRFLIIYLKFNNALWRKRRKIIKKIVKYSQNVYKTSLKYNNFYFLK